MVNNIGPNNYDPSSKKLKLENNNVNLKKNKIDRNQFIEIPKELRNEIFKESSNKENIDPGAFKPRAYSPSVKKNANFRRKYKHIENVNSSSKSSYNNTIIDENKRKQILKDEVAFGKKEITLHFEKKIQAFFSILMKVWGKKDLQFFISNTEAQAESAQSLSLVPEQGKRRIRIKLNAVHNSTLPSLSVCNLSQYKNSMTLDTTDTKPEIKKSIFLKNSSFYLNQNACIDLPRYVNDADIAVEGGKNDRKLRSHAIDIINKVAHNELTPTKGLKKYVEKFLEITVDQKKLDRKNPKVNLVLEIFEKKLTRYINTFNEEREYNKILGFNFYPEHSPELRLKIRQEIASFEEANQEIESSLQCNLETVKKEIYSVISPGKRKNRKTPHLISIFFAEFILNACSEKNRKKISKILSISLDQCKTIAEVDKNYDKTKQRLMNKLDDSFIKQSKVKINSIIDQHLAAKNSLKVKYQQNILQTLIKDKYNSNGQAAQKEFLAAFNSFLLSDESGDPKSPLISDEQLQKYLSGSIALTEKEAFLLGVFFFIDPVIFRTKESMPNMFQKSDLG